MPMKSKSGEPGAEVSSICPDCGQVLVRPADFSAERLFYLHRKWGGCFPAGRPAGRPATPAAVVSEDDAASRSAAG